MGNSDWGLFFTVCGLVCAFLGWAVIECLIWLFGVVNYMKVRQMKL